MVCTIYIFFLKRHVCIKIWFYLAFKCAYCGFFNKERKTRPNAPRIQSFGEKLSAANETISTDKNAESSTISSRESYEPMSSESDKDDTAKSLPKEETISTVESNDVTMNEDDSSDLSKSYEEKKND